MQQNNRRIVCVGNRLFAGDSAGPMVYDLLAEKDLPPDIQLIEGGLAGLDLLRFVDDAATVIFVDTVSGFDSPEGIIVLTLEEVIEATSCFSYSHANSLLYMLHTIPEIYSNQFPEIYLVGVQGKPQAELVREAAEVTLHMIMDSSCPTMK